MSDYEACLSRIRTCRAPVQNKQRKNDVERILFSRRQEDTYDLDELYAVFQDTSTEQIAEIRAAIVDSKWHFMDSESRYNFLESHLPELIGILARGYLFADALENPRGRIEYTLRAFCAWCSVPDKKKASPKEDWQFKSDFRELHGEFPELVDANFLTG